MKKLMMTAFVAGQLIVSTQPAIAAELAETPTQRAGAFAGVRLHLPLDGEASQRPIRVGLTVAPTLHSRSTSGERQLRIGEGLELGIAGREPVRLSIGGTPVNRLARAGTGPNGPRAGVSTVGWIAIGAGAVVALLGVTYLVFDEMMDCDADEECS